jgi:hypothetical protein
MQRRNTAASVREFSGTVTRKISRWRCCQSCANPKFDEVTSPQLAVDGNVEKSTVSEASMFI